ESLAQELQMQPERVEDDVKFIEMGLDSIIGVTWIKKINQQYGLSIGATKVYAYPTIAEMATYVLEEGKKQGLFQTQKKGDRPIPKPCPEAIETPSAAQVPLDSQGLQSKDQKSARSRLGNIAVIGMSGQFPQAKTLSEYWKNLKEGRDCIS